MSVGSINSILADTLATAIWTVTPTIARRKQNVCAEGFKDSDNLIEWMIRIV
jgi:hypothetical protein